MIKNILDDKEIIPGFIKKNLTEHYLCYVAKDILERELTFTKDSSEMRNSNTVKGAQTL